MRVTAVSFTRESKKIIRQASNSETANAVVNIGWRKKKLSHERHKFKRQVWRKDEVGKKNEHDKRILESDSLAFRT